MGISCSCDGGYDIMAVGDPRFVTCRTERKSSCCGKVIKPGDGMYMQSMFDYVDACPVAPFFICEPCGDMMLNLSDIGFCYNLGENIVQQWRDYQANIKEDQLRVDDFLLLLKDKNFTIQQFYDTIDGYYKNKIPYQYFYAQVTSPLIKTLDNDISNIIYIFSTKNNHEKSL